jgi:hypothetical protein
MRIVPAFNSSKVSYPEMALFPLSFVLRRFVSFEHLNLNKI